MRTLLCLLMLILAGCSRSERSAAAASTPKEKEYALTGEVVALAPERNAIIAKHDEIPGYMPPMTMEFIVEAKERAKLAEGRRFRARLLDDGSGTLRLFDVVPLDPVKEDVIKAAASQLRQETSMRGKDAYREIGEATPQFTLYDQNGEVFPVSRVRGKWVVLNFIYTRCPIATMCPASTLRMTELQAAAKQTGRSDLELLSISLDPTYDTPPVLKQYAEARGIDGANFHFLTGPEGAVRDLLLQFGVIVEPGENFLKHTLSTILINPAGRLVYRVDGTAWKPQEFLARLPDPAQSAGRTARVLTLPDAVDDTGESSLHTGPDGTTYLTYAGPGRTKEERALWLATLAPNADGWSQPRIIVSTPRLMENWADFATLTVATDGTLWAQWFQSRSEDDYGYEGWCARSADRGASWSPPAPLGHEFVSLAPLAGGRVLAVWLESTRVRDPAMPRTKRDPNAPRPAKDPSAPYVPSMQLKARLLGPEGGTLRDWLVDPDVCNCCQTTLAGLPGDSVLLAYRGHTAGEIRDNCVRVFDGENWSPRRTVHDDGWAINACPVNGPAVTAHEGQAAVAWFTAAEGLARVQAKHSADAGETFGPALPIDLGRPIGRIDLVMLADGSAVVSWLEGGESHVAGLYVRRIFPEGALSAPRLLANLSTVRASGFPRLAARKGTHLPVVVSWTAAQPSDPTNPRSGATTRIQTAELLADELIRATATAGLVPRGKAGAWLELCGIDAGLLVSHSSNESP